MWGGGAHCREERRSDGGEEGEERECASLPTFLSRVDSKGNAGASKGSTIYGDEETREPASASNPGDAA